jgi:hypothetical protein
LGERPSLFSTYYTTPAGHYRAVAIDLDGSLALALLNLAPARLLQTQRGPLSTPSTSATSEEDGTSLFAEL